MPAPRRTHFKVIAYNTTDRPVSAAMTGWNVTAGDWTMTAGVDADGDDVADAAADPHRRRWRRAPRSR